jgi:hypothetical protein
LAVFVLSVAAASTLCKSEETKLRNELMERKKQAIEKARQSMPSSKGGARTALGLSALKSVSGNVVAGVVPTKMRKQQQEMLKAFKEL